MKGRLAQPGVLPLPPTTLAICLERILGRSFLACTRIWEKTQNSPSAELLTVRDFVALTELKRKNHASWETQPDFLISFFLSFFFVFFRAAPVAYGSFQAGG